MKEWEDKFGKSCGVNVYNSDYCSKSLELFPVIVTQLEVVLSSTSEVKFGDESEDGGPQGDFRQIPPP